MKLFVYEWVCGGGFLDHPAAPPDSLRAEGWAMLRALLEDFERVDGVDLAAVIEPGLLNQMAAVDFVAVATSASERDRLFTDYARQADATLLVAPEFDGILLGLARRTGCLGGKLLSPNPDFVEVASDKQSTAERLFAAGVPVPRGAVLMPGERSAPGFRYPALLKRIDGAGSLGLQVLEEGQRVPTDAGGYRLEEIVEGMPVSVAALCGPAGRVTLEPCAQHLSDDGLFAYHGGSLPIEPELRQRAKGLAEQALDAMPSAVGYVGVDMVLGRAADGSGDTVIEVNPRCTTSYAGLRAATDANLAAIWYAVATGGDFAPPEFDRAVQWTADGKVQPF